VRLVNACEPAFRNLVRGALLTGCRYSELASMQAADFNADAGVVTVRTSKAGKPRHVVLTDEGRKHFADMTAGKLAGDAIFARADGGRWGKSHHCGRCSTLASAPGSSLQFRSTCCATRTVLRSPCAARRWG
jgi:integrase